MASHTPSGASIVEQFTAPKSSGPIIFSLMGIGLLFFLIGVFAFPPAAGHGDGHGDAHGDEHAVVAHTDAPVRTVAQDDPEGHAADTDHDDDHATGAAHGENDHAEGGHGEAAAGGHHGGVPSQGKRIWANLLICGFYFSGVGLMSVFFLAVSYVADAGWMGVVRRVAEATSFVLPVGVGIVLITLFAAGPSLYSHWWPTAEYNPLVEDPILAKKTWWLGPTAFYIRAVLYAILWIGFWWWMRKVSLAEDKSEKDLRGRLLTVSAPFIIVFALSWSAASWDWVMSLEPHWFSTMFGVYTFASLFVTALALITIVAIYLNQNGLLPVFNKSHLHDLGKFVFAFSIFWTYIWFCQFLLIWYANIPEETQYFIDRVGALNQYNGPYAGYFFGTFVICFIVPFFGLMTAGSKRIAEYLAIIGFVVVLGHWFDVSMMVLPGTMGTYGGFGFLELGMFVFFVGVFFLVTRYGLSQAPLIAKKDRYIKESIVHNYH